MISSIVKGRVYIEIIEGCLFMIFGKSIWLIIIDMAKKANSKILFAILIFIITTQHKNIKS